MEELFPRMIEYISSLEIDWNWQTQDESTNTVNDQNSEDINLPSIMHVFPLLFSHILSNTVENVIHSLLLKLPTLSQRE